MPISPVSEALAPFRGTGSLTPSMLVRGRAPLALAQLSLADGSHVLDLDDPAVLRGEGLRPSQVTTAERQITQAHAARLYARRPLATALRWWSTIEASLINLTVFDRAQDALEAIEVVPLSVDHPAVEEAARLLALLP